MQQKQFDRLFLQKFDLCHKISETDRKKILRIVITNSTTHTKICDGCSETSIFNSNCWRFIFSGKIVVFFFGKTQSRSVFKVTYIKFCQSSYRRLLIRRLYSHQTTSWQFYWNRWFFWNLIFVLNLIKKKVDMSIWASSEKVCWVARQGFQRDKGSGRSPETGHYWTWRRTPFWQVVPFHSTSTLDIS